LRLYVLIAVLCVAPSAWASSMDERAVQYGPAVLELSRHVCDRVPPALAPSPWKQVVRGFDHGTGQLGNLAGLVAPSMDALDTFFHDWEAVPGDKVLHVVVRDGALVFDLVAATEASARPLSGRMRGLRVQAPTDARLLPPETEGLLELPSEVSQMALLVSHVAAVLEARALEFVVTFRSFFGLRYSPQALKPVQIVHGGGRIRMPQGDPLVDAYRDREEDEDEDPMVARKFVLRSGVKILLGFCLGLLFWGVIRNL
jgi:hypothetical protein